MGPARWVRRLGAGFSLFLLVGCGGWTAADEQILIKFFERSRVYDTTMLAPIATVAFNPRTDGVVSRFEIVERGPEQQAAGGLVSRELTLRAQVRSASGREDERMLHVTMERRGESWLVTRVR